MKTQLLNVLLVVILFLIPTLNFAQAPPLGTAANFVLFSTVGAVGNTGISQITGNVGTNSGAITGFGNVNGQMHTGDGVSGQCSADLLITYNLLNNAVPAFFPAPLLGNGQILNSGVYSISGATTLNGTLTFDAQGNGSAVFIFKLQGPFSAAANSKIKLINGAMACNVFWKVEGLISMAAGTTMRGTVIANNAAINMSVGDTLEGRALSTTGAVNVNGVLAYTPIGCGSTILTGPAAPALATTECYAIFSANGPVTNAGITYATGDVGTNIGLTTGFNPLFVTGMIHPIPDGSTAQCAADLLNVYTYLNALPYDIELLYPAQFGNNLVLTPHTYIMNAATTFTGNLYLNAQGNASAVFVIKIYGALSTSTYSNVILTNGTVAKNVYWLVSGAVSINNYSIFKGTIVCNNGAIDLTTGVSLEGRALTTTGALGTTAITATMPPGCGGSSSPGIIVQPPANQSACIGSLVNIPVIASGTGLTYQWRKGVENLVNGGAVSGATSPILTINPVSLSDIAPDYNVVVSGTFLPSVTSVNSSLAVNTLPAAAAGANRAICLNSITTLGAAPITGSTYLWSSDPAGYTSTMANPIVAPLVTTIYTVVETITATGCVNVHSVVVTVNTIPVPTIAGTNNLCANSGYYLYTSEVNQTNYIWTISSGGTITYGQGTNQIQVSWSNAGAQFVTVNYTSAAGCQAAIPTTYNVTVNGIPGTAGDITGLTAVCQGAMGVTYSVGAIAYTTSYVWSLPVGATIASGSGTNSITVDFAANASSGPITVFGANYCGSGSASPPLNVTLNSLPDAAGSIDGQSEVCLGGTGYIYMIAVIPNATGYFWILPAGATINGVQNSNIITIDFASNASSGSITVVGTNNCGAGPLSSIAVTMSTKPSTPSITANGYILTSSAVTGNQWYHDGNVITGATAQTYTVPANQPGWYWTVINPLGCSSDESNHIYMLGVGVDEITLTKFNVYPVPNDGHFTASIACATDASFNIYIYNYLGVMIYQKTGIAVSGTVEQTIDISTAPAGVYTVVFKNSENNVIRKILLTK